MSRPPRILVTGSRDYTDRDAVREALLFHWKDLGSRLDTVLIQGECQHGGADLFAKECWLKGGMPIEGYYAAKDPNKPGWLLGPERNQKMVDSGADICIAFPLEDSRGTWDCINKAKAAGIPVTIVEAS
nr:hypothetical protein [Rhodococcus sp. (in: high G+C Gram-positive bacteria)]